MSWRFQRQAPKVCSALAVVLLAAVAAFGDPASAATAYKVARVIDGDTIVLTNGMHVRLVQIDAPEVKGNECYSAQATKALKTLLPRGRTVRLQTDPKLDKVDRYGRRLAYVFKGKELVQRTLVLRGAASPWFYGGDRGRYAAKLLSAAKHARAARRGLWGACRGTVLDPLHAVTTKAGATARRTAKCHPSYKGQCLDPSLSDYDCAGGSGNGPGYVYGTVRVVGPDVYRLDADGDGYGCE